MNFAHLIRKRVVVAVVVAAVLAAPAAPAQAPPATGCSIQTITPSSGVPYQLMTCWLVAVQWVSDRPDELLIQTDGRFGRNDIAIAPDFCYGSPGGTAGPGGFTAANAQAGVLRVQKSSLRHDDLRTIALLAQVSGTLSRVRVERAADAACEIREWGFGRPN